jgi:hypothetical protein
VKKYILIMALILIFVIGLGWVMTSEEGKIFKIRRTTYSTFGQFCEDASFVINNRKPSLQCIIVVFVHMFTANKPCCPDFPGKKQKCC